jgi:thioredoxin-related protein
MSNSKLIKEKLCRQKIVKMKIFLILIFLFVIDSAAHNDDRISKFQPNSKYALYRAFDTEEFLIPGKLSCLRKHYPTYFCRVFKKDQIDGKGLSNCFRAKSKIRLFC